MYWPVFSAKRLHLSPSGIHLLPPTSQEDQIAARVLAQTSGPPTAGLSPTPPPSHSSHNNGPSGSRLQRAQAAATAAAHTQAGPSSSSSRFPSAQHTDATIPASSSGSDGSSGQEPEELLDLARSRSGTHWAALSAHTLSVWSSRPAQCVAALRRTRKSIDEYGHNRKVHWRSNGLGFVVETTQSFLLLYTLSFLTPSIFSYVPPTGSGSKSSISGEIYAPTPSALTSAFQLSPGEKFTTSSSGNGVANGSSHSGLGGGNSSSNSSNGGQDGASSAGSANAEMCELGFSMVLKIDAGLGSCRPTENFLLVATLTPPAVQTIPWPDAPTTGGPAPGSAKGGTKTVLLDRLSWIQLSAVSNLRVFDQHGGGTEQQQDGISPQSEGGVGGNGQEAVVPQEIYVEAIEHSRAMDMFVWITSDGRAHVAHLSSSGSTWSGKTFHGLPNRRGRKPSGFSSNPVGADSGVAIEKEDVKGKHAALDAEVPPPKRAVASAVNARFSLMAIGQQDGTVSVYTYRSQDKVPTLSHSLSLRQSYKSTASHLDAGSVTSMSWTSDGHGLAVAWQRGWAVWSTFGKLMACSVRENESGIHKRFIDTFLFGAKALFWVPGNTELYFLASRRVKKDGTQQKTPLDPDNQLFVLPFAKSTIAGQHSPDNTRFAFVQLDDSLLVYRGSDQPDMSIINPESDTWHHIKVPPSYMANNWPLRYACISVDGKLIAVAGRRGLAHYSTLSGRWKTYGNPQQEQSFAIRGGMQWFHHVLVAACDCGGEYQIRMYSRDLPLDNSQLLHVEKLNSPVLLTSLFEDSLLVYTADNTFYHYLITTTSETIRLKLCGSITFDGVVGEPTRVRAMSWMVPPSQQEFGDPIDDLTVAAIIFLVDGKLVLLRPRRLGHDEEEVSYDMQVLADQIEFYWTHLQGIGGLENSLWGYDGNSVKVWLNALTLEQPRAKAINASGDEQTDEETEDEIIQEDQGYKTIEESVTLALDFYPLCVLMEKGIIIGVDPEISLRKTLDFATFRSSTNTRLFLQQVLRYLLEKRHVRHAVTFASHYSQLIYFAHAMEILLHDVLEDEADAEEARTPTTTAANGESSQSLIASSDTGKRLLPAVIQFLDHFDDALKVVVNCARKTELTRWTYLFAHAGNPVELFEKCLEADDLRTAASYLLVLHSLETAEESTDMTVRLLRRAASEKKWALCRDLLRFLRSVDETGEMVRVAISRAGLLDGASADVSAAKADADAMTPTAASYPQRLESPAIVIDAAPSLNRTTSAPTHLDSTLEEEEEEAAEQEEEEEDGEVQHALDYGSPRRHTVFAEKTTLLHPSAAHSTKDNGGSASEQEKTADVSTATTKASKRISVQRRVSVPVPADQLDGALRNVSGLGMSLSRVGLRSSDRLASPAQPGSSGTSASFLHPMGAGRNSPRPLTSASPTRTVEEFVIE